MSENEVIKAINSVIGNKRKNCMFGEYSIANGAAKIDRADRGGVYGIAIKLKDGEDPSKFLQLISEKEYVRKIKPENWRMLGNGYYPLYWGKDINLGFRLYEHAKGAASSASIRLAARGIEGYNVIYGAVFCMHKGECEKELRKEYPDILITYKKINK